jgi:hypothetical protein
LSQIPFYPYVLASLIPEKRNRYMVTVVCWDYWCSLQTIACCNGIFTSYAHMLMAWCVYYPLYRIADMNWIDIFSANRNMSSNRRTYVDVATKLIYRQLSDCSWDTRIQICIF